MTNDHYSNLAFKFCIVVTCDSNKLPECVPDEYQKCQIVIINKNLIFSHKVSEVRGRNESQPIPSECIMVQLWSC